MSATARAPLVRAGPGVSAWTALPERDRSLLLWLVQGDVVTAELAALLSYGHRRIAQRRRSISLPCRSIPAGRS